eukprot:5411265-Amphidinium_carterae.1
MRTRRIHHRSRNALRVFKIKTSCSWRAKPALQSRLSNSQLLRGPVGRAAFLLGTLCDAL